MIDVYKFALNTPNWPTLDLEKSQKANKNMHHLLQNHTPPCSHIANKFASKILLKVGTTVYNISSEELLKPTLHK
jgi:hypothetical protein